MLKRVLVTGGAGYIGTFVVNELLEKGYHVVVLDRLVYGNDGLDKIKASQQFQFIHGDICNESDVDQAIENVDAVIALAAIVGDPACNVNKDLTRKINYNSNELLLDKCRKNKIKRMVFASSCSVYGKNGGKEYLSEESALEPVSLYAETRILSEQLFLRQNDICSVVLRLSTIFGLAPRMRFDLAVNLLTGKVATGEPIEIFGGNQWRPFLHAADAARAFVIAMEAPEEKVRGQIFNVGNNDSNFQINQIGDMIQKLYPLAVVRQSSLIDDQRDYHVSFEKIEKVLHFKTNRRMINSIKEIFNYVKDTHIDIFDEKFHNVKIWKRINQQRFLPFAVPDVGELEKKEILDTIDSGWLSTGPKVGKFEKALQQYFKTDGLHCIPVNSCTAALHLQLLAYEIGNGDEVITTPLTFCSTVHTILQVGAKPVLVDIDPKTYNIDINAIEEKITAKTKAIVPVYYGGNPFDFDMLDKLAKQNGVFILADAAHAIGGRYKGRLIGTFEDSAAFSFYATKNMTTGEGGLITTKNDKAAKKIRKMLSFGMDKDAWKRYSNSGSWYYEISEVGFKYNFTDIQASFGLHQLEKIDRFNQLRNDYCQIYDNEFGDCKEVILHQINPEDYPTRHLYPILLNLEMLRIDRNDFIKQLREKNIGTSVHYVPIHHHPYFQKVLGHKPGDFPNTDWFYDREISMPIYTKLSKSDYLRIIGSFKAIISENRK